MFNIKKLFAIAKTKLAFRNAKSVLHNPKITVVYSNDSMHSIAAAGMIREHARGHATKAQITFTEVGEFHVRQPISDVYIWLDMPKLNVVENPDLKKAYDKARHISLQGAGTGTWSKPMASRMAAAMGSLINASDMPVVLCSEFTKMTRETYLSHCVSVGDEEHVTTLFVGLLLNAALALEWAAPSDMQDMTDEAIWTCILRLSEFEYGMIPFGSDETPLSEVLGIYDFIKKMQQFIEGAEDGICPWLLNIDVPNGLTAAAAESRVAAQYRNDIARMREAVFKNGIRQLVTAKFGKKRSTLNLLTTRIQNDFWLARRLIGLTGMCFHNTRMTVTGHHTTTNGKGDIPELYTASHKTRA